MPLTNRSLEEQKSVMSQYPSMSPMDKAHLLYRALAGGVQDVVPTGAGPLVARNMGVPEDPNYMNKMTNIGLAGMTVYHGSPHKFDRFDMGKVGTGQGAQSYGHGLYVAENRAVAASPEYTMPEAAYKRISGHLSPMEEFAQDMVTTGRSPDDVWKAMVQKYGRTAAETAPFQDAYDAAISAKGHLYRVDLPDEHIAKMLDWDKPLSEQPENIQQLLKRDDIRALHQMTDKGLSKATGADLYRNITATLNRKKTGELPSQLFRNNNLSGAVDASQMFRELGIPGIKYLDQGSRGAGQGTRNFVVFDDKILKILGRE